MRQNPFTSAEGWRMWHEVMSNLDHGEENKRRYEDISVQGQIKESYLINRALDPRLVDYNYQQNHFYIFNRDKILFKDSMMSDIEEDPSNPRFSRVSDPNSMIEMITHNKKDTERTHQIA